MRILTIIMMLTIPVATTRMVITVITEILITILDKKITMRIMRVIIIMKMEM